MDLIGALVSLTIAVTGAPSQTSFAATAGLDQSQTVEQYVTAHVDAPILAEVASCESHNRQFDNKGNVLKNANSTAVGVFQIMSSIHASLADENLGLDIFSLEGNVAYANYLYETQGLKPWAASKSCWSKSQAYKDMQGAKVAVAN